MNEHWKNFVSLVNKDLPEFDDEAAEMILFTITDDIGILFSMIRDEMQGEESKDDMVVAIGHLYFNIALMELYWNLPPSLYTEYIGEEEMGIKDPSVTIHTIYSGMMLCLSKISSSLLNDDRIKTQSNLNKLIQHVYDLCIHLDINTLAPLRESIKEIQIDYKVESTDNFVKDYIDRTSLIKELEYDEVLFEVIIDNRRSDPYKGVSIIMDKDKFLSTTGNIISDFFNCMNYMSRAKKNNNNFAINYGPKFRKFLTDNQDIVWSGFLIGYDVVSVKDIQKGKKAVNGVISINKEARPILMNNEIKGLDSLIDYIDKHKNNVLKDK